MGRLVGSSQNNNDATVRCRTCGAAWPATYTVCPNNCGALTGAADTDVGATYVDPSPVLELARGTVVGEYVIEDRIGRGAMGVVYAAEQPAIGKRVAIKVMNPRLSGEPEAAERFVGEARAVAAIHHPGIIDVFGFGSLPDGRLYFVMELLHGESLRERMARGRLGFAEALDVIDQMARGLQAAHDHNVIHRDLKPDNVFVEPVANERPIVKILDFGLAKPIDGDGVRRTQTGQMIGTPLYMSPEQCRAKDVDQRTDIYALGCIAYELVCGRVPFDADNIAELIASHLGEPAPAPRSLWSKIPPQLDELLRAMIAKDPALRPTLARVREVIATAVPGQIAPPRPRARRRRAIAIVAGVVLAAGVSVVLLANRSETTAAPEPRAAEPIAKLVVTQAPPPDASVPDAVAVAAAEPVAPQPTRTAPPPARKPSVHVTKPVEPTPAPPVVLGTLSLRSKPACDVSVDGKATGTRTPTEIKLAAGHHQIGLTNDELGIHDAFGVDLSPGEVVKQVKDYGDRSTGPTDPNATTLNPFKKKPQ